MINTFSFSRQYAFLLFALTAVVFFSPLVWAAGTAADATSKSELEAAVKVNPVSAIAHRNLGAYYLKQRDLTGANNELSAALKLNPGDQEAASELVGLWQEQLSRAPSANAHFGLARAYQLGGCLDLAQAEFREVVRLDPNNPALPAARQSFKRALARQEAEKDLKQAEVLESQGRTADAYQLVSQAMVYSPGNTSYKLYQAELLTKLGQPAMAKQIYLNVLMSEPENQTAMQGIKLLSNVAMPATGAAVASTAAGSAVSAQAAATAALTAGGAGPSSGIDPLSSFVRQLRDQIFDQNEPQGAAEVSPSPVADPAGMLHGLGDTSLSAPASTAGSLNAGTVNPGP